MKVLTSMFCDELLWIDSVSDLETVVEELRSENQFALSCHGDNLGREGTLDIMAIGTNNRKVFVFDVTKMGATIFQTGLSDLLTSKEKIKLMFDCRMAADALFKLYGVELDGFIDIQLLDIVQRQRIAKKPCTWWFLSDLRHVIKRHLGDDENDSDKCLEEISKDELAAEDANDTFWAKRQENSIIRQELLDYCAICTLKLFQIYDHLQQDDSFERNEILLASNRYADFIRTYETFPERKFYLNFLLPDNILIFYPKEEDKEYEKCKGCLKDKTIKFLATRQGKKRVGYCLECSWITTLTFPLSKTVAVTGYNSLIL